MIHLDLLTAGGPHTQISNWMSPVNTRLQVQSRHRDGAHHIPSSSIVANSIPFPSLPLSIHRRQSAKKQIKAKEERAKMVLLVLYHILSFLYLFPYGIYHLIASVRSFLLPSISKPSPSPPPPPPSSSSSPSSCSAANYSARAFYPLPFPSTPLRLLPLHLTLLSLLFSLLLSPFLYSPSLLSLQFTVPLVLFTLIALSLLLFPLPSDLTFLLASLSFFLFSLASSNTSSSYPPSDLQSKSLSITSLISLISCLSSLTLAISPRLFLAELALSGSIALHGLWSLQSGLSLYVDSFIPNGCHKLLEKSATTRCDLDESRARAFSILDLSFAFDATLVAAIVVLVYGVVARVSGVNGGNGGVGGRRHNGGNYEVLPTSSSAGVMDDSDHHHHHHVQMKAIAKSSAQE